MASLIFDMQSGIAGDMSVAALLDLGVDEADFRKELATLPLEFSMETGNVQRGGIRARTFQVKYPHQHHHRRLPDIRALIGQSRLPEPVKEHALAVFQRLAEAEAVVHGTTVDHVHFHEVGAVDAVADICGACLALHVLGVTDIFLSPFVHGFGTVKTEHGLLAVPAPAVVELTRGFASRRLEIEAELTTPTGAALAVTRGRPLSELGAHVPVRAGYGAGGREFPGFPNALRAVLVTAGQGGDEVAELTTQLDDTTGELLGRAQEKLLSQGALDVYFSPAQMKKNRPGTLVCVLCAPADRERLGKTLLLETGSIGYRWSQKTRVCLPRTQGVVQTRYGDIKIKAIDFFGERRTTPEYESCREAADRAGVALPAVYDEVRRMI